MAFSVKKICLTLLSLRLLIAIVKFWLKSMGQEWILIELNKRLAKQVTSVSAYFDETMAEISDNILNYRVLTYKNHSSFMYFS